MGGFIHLPDAATDSIGKQGVPDPFGKLGAALDIAADDCISASAAVWLVEDGPLVHAEVGAR